MCKEEGGIGTRGAHKDRGHGQEAGGQANSTPLEHCWTAVQPGRPNIIDTRARQARKAQPGGESKGLRK